MICMSHEVSLRAQLTFSIPSAVFRAISHTRATYKKEQKKIAISSAKCRVSAS